MRRIILLLLLLPLAQLSAQALRFHADTAPRVADVPRDSIRNANGSLRITNAGNYEYLMRRIVPLAIEWAGDERLRIDPGFLVALLVKESAGDSLAVSAAPALGLAQLTARTDADLRLMDTEYHFQWMAPEVSAWPRSPFIHRDSSSRERIDSLLQRRRDHGEERIPVRSRARRARLRLLGAPAREQVDHRLLARRVRQPSRAGRINGGKKLTECAD